MEGTLALWTGASQSFRTIAPATQPAQRDCFLSLPALARGVRGDPNARHLSSGGVLQAGGAGIGSVHDAGAD